MAERTNSSRRNTESETPQSMIETVQIDGLVVMQLIKHCHEMEAGNFGIAQGALLGLPADTRLEITHSFPFTSAAAAARADGAEAAAESDEDYQLAMMRRLRMVNVDHFHVGWYQSANFGNFLSPQVLESSYAYQTSVEDSVVLIFDTGKTGRGFLSMKAYRLTPSALKLFREADFSAESIKNIKVSHDTLFQEVPIVVKNSHLVNELLLELSEETADHTDHFGASFLDLGCANVLEEQLKYLMETVDELNQEAIKFNKYQNIALKQCQEKARWAQKRQLENNARTARGEEPLADEDINKVFKPIPPPSKLNSLILSGQALSTSQNVSQFCSQALAKWFVTDALQKARMNTNH